MKMTNRHNLAVYRLWAPLYDRTLELAFAPARRRAIELLALRPGERVLLLGVGTGSDLPLLPRGVSAIGVDLSPEMLARARAKLPIDGVDVELREGDAQAPVEEPGTFDAVVLHLILSVVPDGAACLRNAMRALKPSGRAVVFDKFRHAGAKVSLARRAVNVATSFFGTDITRSFEEMARGAPCEIAHDEPALFGGAYRTLILKPAAAPEAPSS